MKQNQLVKKIGIIATIVGAISLIVSIICFLGLGVVSGKVEEAVGYKPTALELSEIIDNAKSVAEWFGGELQDIADFIGISAAELTFIQLFLALKIPTLVIGIIALAVGIILMILAKNPAMAKKIGDSVAYGALTVGGAVKTTIDNAIVKCEKCGKTHVAGTKFCTNCGNNLEKAPTTPKMKKCPVCESTILDNAGFCSGCGAVIADGDKSNITLDSHTPVKNEPVHTAVAATRQHEAFHPSDDLD